MVYTRKTKQTNKKRQFLAIQEKLVQESKVILGDMTAENSIHTVIVIKSQILS